MVADESRSATATTGAETSTAPAPPTTPTGTTTQTTSAKTTTGEPIFFYTVLDKYGFLSNFYRSPQRVDGKVYRTNENYYASKKAADPSVEWWIATAPTPFLAMNAGRSLRKGKELREDWDKVKVETMLRGLMAKFGQNNILRANLLATGKREIHEKSAHEFWGSGGQDQLGKCLMKVREELSK